MEEISFGKLGFGLVILGLTILIITFFISSMFGWLMPESTIKGFFVLLFIPLAFGTIFGFMGILRDDSREKALRAFFGGILFLIVGGLMVVLYNLYIRALLG